jgi:hypothetical protein
MLTLELFRRRAFTGAQLAAAAVSSSLFALFLYLTLVREHEIEREQPELIAAPEAIAA